MLVGLTGCKTEKIYYSYYLYAIVNDFEDNGKTAELTVNLVDTNYFDELILNHPEYYSHNNDEYMIPLYDVKVYMNSEEIQTYTISNKYIEDFEEAKEACQSDGIITVEIENGVVCGVETNNHKLIEKPEFPTGVEREFIFDSLNHVVVNKRESNITIYDSLDFIEIYYDTMSSSSVEDFLIRKNNVSEYYAYSVDIDSADELNEFYFCDGNQKNFFITYNTDTDEWNGWYIYGDLKFDGHGGIDAYIDGTQYNQDTDEIYITQTILGSNEEISIYDNLYNNYINIIGNALADEKEYINSIKASKDGIIIHYNYENGVITSEK